MRKKRMLTAVLASIFLTTVTVASASDREIPTAPADWLAKTNPNDVDDADDGFLKKAGKLYKRKCKKCHGGKGDGKGSATSDLEIKPPSFSASGYLESRKDGQLFWILMNGSEGTDMEAYGPGTDVNLSEAQIWQLITYMRAKFTH